MRASYRSCDFGAMKLIALIGVRADPLICGLRFIPRRASMASNSLRLDENLRSPTAPDVVITRKEVPIYVYCI